MAGDHSIRMIEIIIALVALYRELAELWVRVEERNHIKRRRISHISGHLWTEELLQSEGADCHDVLRMNSECFKILRDMLAQRGLLKDERLSVEEQMAICFYMLGHNVTNRVMANRFNHSGETISRHFHRVLDAICKVFKDYIKFPRNPPISPNIRSSSRFWPYFKDCMGAIDGTHIPAHVPIELTAKYRNRYGFLSQNCLMACGFDMKFHYVLAGWEGSAHDSTILFSAMNRVDKLQVLEGKFYIVDAGFSDRPGFLTPYRNVRYHLNEFSNYPPANAKEIFNLRHSSLRTTVERVIEVVKNRFACLRLGHKFSLTTQRDIVLACCVMHNHIVMYNIEDPILQSIGRIIADADHIDPPQRINRSEATVPTWTHATWPQFRDSLAEQMWIDYEEQQSRQQLMQEQQN